MHYILLHSSQFLVTMNEGFLNKSSLMRWVFLQCKHANYSQTSIKQSPFGSWPLKRGHQNLVQKHRTRTQKRACNLYTLLNCSAKYIQGVHALVNRFYSTSNFVRKASVKDLCLTACVLHLKCFPLFRARDTSLYNSMFLPEIETNIFTIRLCSSCYNLIIAVQTTWAKWTVVWAYGKKEAK